MTKDAEKQAVLTQARVCLVQVRNQGLQTRIEAFRRLQHLLLSGQVSAEELGLTGAEDRCLRGETSV